MDSKNLNLYRWKRRTNQRIYSRTQQVTSAGDVQDWLKKVEAASDLAGAEVLGEATMSRYHGESLADRVTRDTRHFDQTHTEAQDLLQEWMTDKLLRGSDDLDADLNTDNIEDDWRAGSYQSDVRLEWDRMLEDNGACVTRSRAGGKQSDPYGDIYELDDVDVVLDALLKQDYVKTSTREMSVDKTYVDPRLKMHLRQEQVKTNRLNREETTRKKMDEKQKKKEALFSARQIIQKETADKERGRKHEESLIQQEMTRIRKQLQEERLKQHPVPSGKGGNWCHEPGTDRSAKQNSSQDSDTLVPPPTSRKQMLHNLHADTSRHSDKQSNDHASADSAYCRTNMVELDNKVFLLQTKIYTRTLRQHFGVWYASIMERRLHLGKAAAISDWKLLNKIWASWKTYCRQKKLDKEMAACETSAKETERKLLMARNRHRLVTLRRSFVAWQVWVEGSVGMREESANVEKTRAKMAAFLRAAENRVNSERNTCPAQNEESVEKFHSDEKQLINSKLYTRSNPNTPKQAWQFTKKDVKVTKEEIEAAKAINKTKDNVDQGFGDIPLSLCHDIEKLPLSARTNCGEIPLSSRRSYLVNGYQHRHTSQQKMLQDQKKLIKDQQRMIEDLQFEQNKQTLVKQAEKFQQLQTQVSEDQLSYVQAGSGGSSQSIPSSRTQTTEDTSRTDVNQPERLKSAESSTQNTGRTLNEFINNMNTRALDRVRQKTERDEQRRKADAERLEQLKGEESERERQIQDEKMQKRKIYLEKKQLEKQREDEKQRQMEKLKSQMEAADGHYKMAVVKYRGYLPWRILVQKGREQRELAERHHSIGLLRSSWQQWQAHVVDICAERNKRVECLHNRIIVRRCFSAWTKYKNYVSIQESRALRHYQTRLLQSIVVSWLDYATEEKMRSWRNERLAQEHDTRRLVKRCFTGWRRFPDVLKQQIGMDKRRLEMKRKVAELLPDYTVQDEVHQSGSYL